MGASEAVGVLGNERLTIFPPQSCSSARGRPKGIRACRGF